MLHLPLRISLCISCAHVYAIRMRLTARQSIRIFGWLDPRPILAWADILRLGLTLDTLLSYGIRPADLVSVQPDPSEWVRHAGAGHRHARVMQPWGANPFVHLGADLADVLGMELTVVEMLRMDITYAQLRRAGMTDRTERMFKLDDEEWDMLGRPSRKI